MIEIVVMVCMIDAPTQCRDVNLNFAAENITPMQCVMQGQVEMSKWIDEHPGWQVKKWRCGRAGQFAKI